ncbi:hypothetical protein OEZ49_19670, partial [Ruegeria sp. WL0004]
WVCSCSTATTLDSQDESLSGFVQQSPMNVSIDWLVGRSDSKEIGEAERRQIGMAMYKLVVDILKDIDRAQDSTEEPIVAGGKIGNREIGDYAVRVMLHFMATENLFPSGDYDTFRILDEMLQMMHG